MAKELKQTFSVLADIKKTFCESFPSNMELLGQWTLSILKWTIEVVQDKQPLFSQLRHLVIGNYLEWVNMPKHSIKQ